MVASREIIHFVYRNGNWYQDESPLVNKDGSIKYIATVLRQGHKRLVLIEQLQNRLNRERQWLDTESYPRAWFDEPLQTDRTCRFRIRQRTQKTADSSIPQKFQSKVNFDKKTRLNFSTDDEKVGEKGYTGRFDYFASFSTLEFSRGEQDLSIYIRASINLRGKSLLKGWNDFFGATLQPLLLNNVEKVNRLASARLESEQKKVSVGRSEAEHVSPSLGVAIGQNSVPPDEAAGHVVTHSESVGSQLLTRSKTVIQHLKNWTLEVYELVRTKVTRRNATYISMVIVLIGVLIVGLSVRDSTLLTYASDKEPLRKADIESQYVLFVLALLSPAVAWIVERQLLQSLVGITDTQNKGVSSRSYYQQTKTLKRLIEVIVFTFIAYLIISISAWPNVGDNTHLWIWSDRQTFGLVITMLVGVLSALLSNSLRDLSTQNTLIVVNTRRKIEEIRYLLNEIHELADRFWSEYDAHYKNVGKIFLFRANQFAQHTESNQNFLINSVLNRIDGTIQDVMGSSSVSSNTRDAKEIIDRLETSHVFQKYEWTEGGVVNRDHSKGIVPWVEHFQVSDILKNRTPRKFTPDNFYLQSNELIKEFETDAAMERIGSSNKPFEEVLNSIVARFVANNDGRFCVADISDKQKQILSSLRLIRAVVADAPFSAKEGDIIATKKVWGYFPTDERLTLWFIHAMRQSTNWLAVNAEQQGESLDGEFDLWLSHIYQQTVTFEKKNGSRVKRLDELVQKLEAVLSTEGLPSGLILDDVHLLRILLSVGSDALNTLDAELEYQTGKDATIAKILAYASTYYSVLVWGRGSDRALLPSFPSPFAGVQGVETRSRHATVRLENLRQALSVHLAAIDSDNEVSLDSQRRIVLEISNRQGPLLNWMRAARAYSRREKFLFGQISDDDLKIDDGLVVEVPETRELMMRQLFMDEFLAQEQVKDDFSLFKQISDVGEPVKIRGPRSLKTARKSSYVDKNAESEENNV